MQLCSSMCNHKTAILEKGECRFRISFILIADVSGKD